MNEPLQDWITGHGPALDLLWREGWGSQVAFARDRLQPLIGCGLPYPENRSIARVISTHRSKSIELPVYSIERPDVGLRIVARNNFHDWKMSVISERPVDADFSGLFAATSPTDPAWTGDPLRRCYFEGFPEDLVFGYYAESDRRRWSAELGTNEELWTAAFLVCRALGILKPFKWSTKAERDAEKAAAALVTA